ncbi:hypothetical protein HPB49_005961 [Dermacentor silvarum]|uniref:Uncharacterized protein n=1 Tax=Dermacentor silvarum TaxID=543639 RepID=A0ACB8DNC9_DERSI|nr:hypothetical protein HPB49_005961 [Dermacentor silvarum]
MFVGDLSADVDDTLLYQAFSQRYPSVRAAKVVLDPTGLSKGFGFVRFSDGTEYQEALVDMQHSLLVGSKPIRVGVANPRRKPNAEEGVHSEGTKTDAFNSQRHCRKKERKGRENGRNFAGRCKQARGSEHMQLYVASTILQEKANKLGIDKAASVDTATINTWKETVASMISDYKPKDIFNANKACLFFKVHPSKTLSLKDGIAEAVGDEAFADCDQLDTAMETVGDRIAYSDYVSIDDAVVTSEVLPVNEIVTECADARSSEDEVEKEREQMPEANLLVCRSGTRFT